MAKFLSLSTHPIFKLELLPVWIALVEWEGHLSGAQCVFYLDNEAAKASLVNGASMQDNGAEIIQAFVYAEMKVQVKVWFARVPASSNISDGPSRFDVEEMEMYQVRRRTIHWQDLFRKMRRDGSNSWGFKTGSWLIPSCVGKTRCSVKFSAVEIFGSFVIQFGFFMTVMSNFFLKRKCVACVYIRSRLSWTQGARVKVEVSQLKVTL